MSDAIRVFVSSKQGELDTDREIVRQRAEDVGLTPVLAEDWPPGRADIREEYLARVEQCPIYLGLFYRIYSPPTADEYKAALNNPYREILIYWRSAGVEPADPLLMEFMRGFGAQHVYRKYEQPQDLLRLIDAHLLAALERMVRKLLNLGRAAQGGQLFGSTDFSDASPAQGFLRTLNFRHAMYDPSHAQFVTTGAQLAIERLRAAGPK